MTTEEKRKALYVVLLKLCKGRWASLIEIDAELPYEEPKLEGYLEGLVHLRELERDEGASKPAEDDGFTDSRRRDSLAFDDEQTFTGYRLTEFGERWAEMSCL